MYFEAVFSFYVLLYHFVGHSFFGLIAFRSFSNIIKWNFSLTLAKLNFYVDMSVWLFVGKQYYRLNEELRAKLYGDMAENAIFCNRKIKQFVPEYAPSISLHEGLARSLNWYWAHPKHQIADEEYNRWLDALISEWSTYLYA